MLRRWLAVVFAQHVILAQETHLQKIADAYSSWAVSSPFNPHPSPPISRPIRQFTHMVTVQAPSQAPQKPEHGSHPVPSPSPISPQNSRPRFIHVPVTHPEPPVQRIQPQPHPQPISKPIQPQYPPHPMYQFSPHVGLPQTLRYPNNTFLLPQRMNKPTITDEDEARKMAAKKHKWGRPTLEMTCEFGFCGGSCCTPHSLPPQQIHAAALPGSNLQHPVLVVLHPSPPQCAPACQPMCHSQCTSRLQYLPMPMPEFFHQYPTCRHDCMPSCHVDCLILPPMVIRCNSYPCRCGAGYQQCTPFSCCSTYMNMRAKYRTMVEDKSEEEQEKRRRKKLRTPLHIPFHGTAGKALVSGDTAGTKSTTALTTTRRPKTTTTMPTTTTPTTTTTTPTTTTTTPTTTTTSAPPPTTTTARMTTTTTIPWIRPIYPEIPMIPTYELWQPKEQIMKAKALEEEENFIRSTNFVEMLAELAQVKSKWDQESQAKSQDFETAEEFLRYLTETGK